VGVGVEVEVVLLAATVYCNSYIFITIYILEGSRINDHS
jgi:hypothetical protein